ncbi:MAG: DUF4430 domain-containing protein [Raoultibacter sp.]|jgi:hypothetical protein
MNHIGQGQHLKRLAALATAALLALFLSFTLGACSSQDSKAADNSSTANSAAETFKTQLVFDTTAIEGGKLLEEELDIKQGTTPLDMLEQAGLTYEAEQSSYGSLVKSIDGVAQGDHGSMSGWLYFVNDDWVDESADKYEVKEGDSIKWVFTTGEE